MGRGIAHVSALNGYSVLLYDIEEEAVQRALKATAYELDQGILKGKTTEEQKQGTLSRIKPITSLDGFAEADIVIEAVLERMDVKGPVFKYLDEICRPEVLLATNTSTMSITQIAGATKRPDRVIGTHFFNPVHKMKMVEIINGLETSPETTALAVAFSESIKKKVVVVQKDYPGFITSRMNCIIGNEAFDMLARGIGTAEDIDTAMKVALNHPMGPFELVDLVGLDTRLRNITYLYETLGDIKYKPNPLHVQYVNAGRFGRKVGKGIFEYDENGNRIG
jgi:3-hydroxybutyryl-CoA dehydrogenase